MLNNKGFSLLELFIVTAIVTALSTLAIVAYNSYIELSAKKTREAFGKSVIYAAEEYITDNPEAVDVSLDTLFEENYLEKFKNNRTTKGKQPTGQIDFEIVESTTPGKLDEYIFTGHMCLAGKYYTYQNYGEEGKTQYEWRTDDTSCNEGDI